MLGSWKLRDSQLPARIEKVPWATGKSWLTKAYAYYLASWAKRMSWAEVAAAFQTSWENVFRSVEMVVTWGLARRDLDSVTSIGVDEVLWLASRLQVLDRGVPDR